MSSSDSSVSSKIVGQTFEDYSGRNLHVTEYNPGDPAGREVVGTLNGRAFATTIPIFRDVFMYRQPPVSREQQERNRKRLGV
jgi:hypothetical protein